MQAEGIRMADHERLSEVRAELAELRKGKPITAFARDIRIAPGTLQVLLADPPEKLRRTFEEWSGTLPAEDGSKKVSPKAIAGRAESVGRIYGLLVEAKREPKETEKEFAALFGLDPEDVQVQQGLRRWRESARPKDPFLTQDDATLKMIVSGDGRTRPGEMRAGILAWAPYATDKSNPGSSFAGRIMTRLLGSLHPLKWGPPTLVGMDFHEILSPDMLRDGRVDAIFSLYDLPSRRLAGFEFIHVPGLTAPLGAIAFFDPRDRPDGLSWSAILDPELAPDLKVFVVGEDAAHLLVRGACAYPKSRVEAIPPAGDGEELRDKIAATLLEAARRYLGARDRAVRGRSASLPEPFVFIADAAMAQEVLERVESLAQGSKELAQLPHEVGSDPRRPRYPIGIAVSAHSGRWRDILQDTMVRELFVNAGPQTARAYAELLSAPSSICVGALGERIPQSAREHFREDVLETLGELETAALQRALSPIERKRLQAHFNRVRGEILEEWFSDAEVEQRSKWQDPEEPSP